MSSEQAPSETRGVTENLLGVIDLGSEIKGMEGYQLRMRSFVMEPGAVLGPVHSHEGRPGLVFVIEGTITDHRGEVATDYTGPGPGWPEDKNTKHWLENRGSTPAFEISVDIIKKT